MKDYVIKVNNISKTINDREILKDVSLELKKNKITGVVGRNGSGKTVLLKILVNLYKVSEGDIIYNDIDIYKDLGVLIESEFLSNETGFNNLKTLASLRGEINDYDIYNVMKKVKLDPLDKTKYKNYSTGMRQKLKIAQAIMEDFKVLILDEPFNGLDYDSVLYFRNLLLDMKDSKTILITSHYKEDIDNLCDIVYEMNKGVLTKIYEKENK